MILDSLPLTPNGKVDRNRLPEPSEERPELQTNYVAPRTPVEEQLAQLWREVLKVDQVGIHDDFFALGGHSLLAIQMAGRLRHDFGVEVNVAALFENPTIEHFAVVVIERMLEAESAECNEKRPQTSFETVV